MQLLKNREGSCRDSQGITVRNTYAFEADCSQDTSVPLLSSSCCQSLCARCRGLPWNNRRHPSPHRTYCRNTTTTTFIRFLQASKQASKHFRLPLAINKGQSRLPVANMRQRQRHPAGRQSPGQRSVRTEGQEFEHYNQTKLKVHEHTPVSTILSHLW